MSEQCCPAQQAAICLEITYVFLYYYYIEVDEKNECRWHFHVPLLVYILMLTVAKAIIIMYSEYAVGSL